LLVSLKQWDIEFALGDAAYDSEKVRQTAEQSGILLISPINRRNSEERKDAYGRVLPIFLKTSLVRLFCRAVGESPAIHRRFLVLL
jgi:hypothetical protein